MNKSLVTNIVALLISIVGIILAEPHIKNIGFYALSGALTNVSVSRSTSRNL